VNASERAHLLGVHLHDQAEAAAVQAVRDDARALGLSRRETERRVDSVRDRARRALRGER
jgi:hypothetical protein